MSSEAAGRSSIVVYVCEHCHFTAERNQPVQCPDCGLLEFRRIHSKAEARRWGELRLLVSAGIIEKLELQPVFPLVVTNDQGERFQIAKYIADFRYYDREKKETVVEDVKGLSTPVFNLKSKHVAAQYGIKIKLT